MLSFGPASYRQEPPLSSRTPSPTAHSDYSYLHRLIRVHPASSLSSFSNCNHLSIRSSFISISRRTARYMILSPPANRLALNLDSTRDPNLLLVLQRYLQGTHAIASQRVSGTNSWGQPLRPSKTRHLAIRLVLEYPIPSPPGIQHNWRCHDDFVLGRGCIRELGLTWCLVGFNVATCALSRNPVSFSKRTG